MTGPANPGCLTHEVRTRDKLLQEWEALFKFIGAHVHSRWFQGAPDAATCRPRVSAARDLKARARGPLRPEPGWCDFEFACDAHSPDLNLLGKWNLLQSASVVFTVKQCLPMVPSDQSPCLLVSGLI